MPDALKGFLEWLLERLSTWEWQYRVLWSPEILCDIHEYFLSCLQYLDCLWAQIQKLKKDRWQERHILRPYLAFDSILCEALQHNLPPFTPPPHTEGSVYPMPRVIFRMFDYTDDPEVCDLQGVQESEGFAYWHLNLQQGSQSRWKHSPVLDETLTSPFYGLITSVKISGNSVCFDAPGEMPTWNIYFGSACNHTHQLGLTIENCLS